MIYKLRRIAERISSKQKRDTMPVCHKHLFQFKFVQRWSRNLKCPLESNAQDRINHRTLKCTTKQNTFWNHLQYLHLLLCAHDNTVTRLLRQCFILCRLHRARNGMGITINDECCYYWCTVLQMDLLGCASTEGKLI